MQVIINKPAGFTIFPEVALFFFIFLSMINILPEYLN